MISSSSEPKAAIATTTVVEPVVKKASKNSKAKQDAVKLDGMLGAQTSGHLLVTVIKCINSLSPSLVFS